VATLIVGGFEFRDWETVWVQHRATESHPLFRFTCAEREPFANRWQALRFRPGDKCTILLGGQLAVTGYITTRQVAYDARNHGVQLDGRGNTYWAAKSSVESKTHSFDKMPFTVIAESVLKPYGCEVRTIGSPDNTPYVRCQANPGETTWDFLERIARPRGIVLGSDHLGNFLVIGDRTAPIVDQLVEGQNILKCQCIITNDPMFQKYSSTSQTAGGSSDGGGEKMFTDASEQFQTAPEGGTAPVYSHLIVPSEQPVWNAAELMKRAQHERLWHEGWEVTAHITVQGWLRSDGALWQTRDVVEVYSPMALLNYPLAIEEATFTQDRNSGTLTTLKLVRPDLLKVTQKYTATNVPLPGRPRGADAEQPPIRPKTEH